MAKPKTKATTRKAKAPVSDTPIKVGRPKKLHQDEASLEVLRSLGRLQCTIREAAAFLKVSTTTLEAYLNEPREEDGEVVGTVRDVFEDGKCEGKLSLRRHQLRLAEKNAAMAIFLGKNWLEQTDRQEHSGPDGGAIPIDLRRMSPEERRLRIAELEAKRRDDAPDGAKRG